MLKLSELKALHVKGLALIYLHPRDKRPLENGWTSGPRKTWRELKRDFNPDYNVGVRLGEASKVEGGYLCCIDVDVKDPAYKEIALKKLKEIIGDDTYPLVLSGSGNGSRHVYAASRKPFKMVEIEKHKGKWEICAYSTGRQMVLPPSIHPSGKAYKWRADFEITATPIFNAEQYRNRSRISQETRIPTRSKFKAVKFDITKLDSRTIDQINGVGVDDRSAALLSIAMKMCRAKLDDNVILSVLSNPKYEIAKAAYEHAQTKDRGRAVKWLRRYTLEKAKYETHGMRLFEGAEDYTKLARLKPKKVIEIKKELKEEAALDIGKGGVPKTSLKNVVHVLEHYLEGGLVGFNEFSCRPYFLKDTPYGGIKGLEISDKDDLALKHYLACHYRFEPRKETCFEAHAVVAQKYRFHPIKAYLETLDWDGRPRLDSWLREAFRSQGPIEYVEAVSRKVLVAAVARIYDPGCKFDHMVVLEGNQGEGKSMSLGMLVGQKWFTDSLGDIHNKDVVDQMLGKWLIEVSELDSIRGRDAEAVKAFVSRQVDRVRLSYARRAEDYPRQCIFIGSTNDDEYLTDETGNRRYWPIKVGLARRKWLKENRDQLWAEAKFRYELGEKLYLTKECEAIARGEQEKRFEVDDWESEIRKIVEKDVKAVHTTTELWRAVNITAAAGHPTMYDSKRIGKIMKRLGFKRDTKRLVVDSATKERTLTKCWVRK